MNKLGRTLVAATAVAGLIATALVVPAAAKNPLKGEGRNMKIVANVAYQGGTDMEFFTQKGRDYALTGAAPGVGGAKAGAFRVIDITTPAKPKLVATLPCSLYQADIQISHDEKTALIAADSAGGPDSCLAVGKQGFMTIDIRNVKKPKPIGFAEIPGGSHNVTAHPTKPYVYNSNSDLAGRAEIQVWSIKNPAKPELVTSVRSLPHAPHDISFNSDGSKIVTAAISHIDLFDTSDPEKPSLTFTTQCPGCSITHDAKFTPDDSGLVIGDEGGGGSPYPCPGGALYFYQLVGGAAPVLTGVYEPEEILLAREGQSGPGACTSHVFGFNKDGSKVAISWYSAGTRLLDVSAMMGAAVGEADTGGVAEIGYFMPDGGTSWSSKFYKSDKYIFSNDTNRGFDVFEVTSK
jgi:hypothetical protein